MYLYEERKERYYWRSGGEGCTKYDTIPVLQMLQGSEWVDVEVYDQYRRFNSCCMNSDGLVGARPTVEFLL